MRLIASLPLLLVVGFSLALSPGLFAATTRYIVDDEAFTKSATDAAAQLQKQGKLVKLKALLAQPPSNEPVKFSAPTTGPVSPTELYGRLRAGTVAVGTFYLCHKCDDWHVNLATGFAVAEDGVISTCAHVLAYDEDEMKDVYAIAVDAEGHVFPVEKLLATDPESDTCLVRIAARGLHPLPVRAGALPGERIFCLSHPNGHYFMFTQGIVARVSQSSTIQEDEDSVAHPKSRPTLSLEVTSEYSPGSSGGPIVDENGNVVAQVNAIETDSDTENGTGGVVTARTATAAEEILRLADPANRPVAKPDVKVDPIEALAALRKAMEAREENEDENADERLFKKVTKAVKLALPWMTDPAQRREFALLAVEALSEDPANRELKKVLPMLSEIGSDKNASREEKSKASHWLIAISAEQIEDAAAFSLWEKQYLVHAASFPDDPELSDLKLSLLDLTEKFAADRLDALAQSLSADPDEEVAQQAKDVAQQAKDILAAAKIRRTLETTPLELKFTALDGTEVDVAKLRGKVLLIDFWATWCGPCIAELPKVKKTYDLLHARGLEVVGISLDEDKGEVEALVKKKGMTWPQHFDGKGWNNALAKRFGISGIPTMWLVDKKGMVVDFAARGEDLGEKIEKLLAQ